jgi:transcriptional antiterminator RfaH
MTCSMIKTNQRKEAVAEDNLLRQGYGCFLPRFRAEKVRRGVMAVIDEPLFPGYVFVDVGAEQSTSPLRSTIGCRGVVRFGQRLADVPVDLVESIRTRCQGAPVVTRFHEGDKVRIVEGGLAGIDGIFCSLEGEDRVVILLTLLQRQQKVAVPLGAVIRG